MLPYVDCLSGRWGASPRFQSGHHVNRRFLESEGCDRYRIETFDFTKDQVPFIIGISKTLFPFDDKNHPIGTIRTYAGLRVILVYFNRRWQIVALGEFGKNFDKILLRAKSAKENLDSTLEVLSIQAR
jgi:hypothetical protein